MKVKTGKDGKLVLCCGLWWHTLGAVGGKRTVEIVLALYAVKFSAIGGIWKGFVPAYTCCVGHIKKTKIGLCLLVVLDTLRSSGAWQSYPQYGNYILGRRHECSVIH